MSITGPVFLSLYAALLVAATLAAALARRRIFAGPPAGAAPELSAEQTAFLNGGPKLAVCASVAGLRAAGALTSTADRRLAPAGPLPDGAGALGTAVHQAAGRGSKVWELTLDGAVNAAVEQIRLSLERIGYAVTAAQRNQARLWALAPAAILVFGVERLVSGIGAEAPIGILAVLLAPAAIGVYYALVKSRRRITVAAHRRLRQLRREHHHLDPALDPAMATYGAAGAATGVGLFGIGALFALDRDFAAEAEVHRLGVSGPLGTGPTGTYGGCGGGDGGGGGGGDSGGGGGGGGCGGGGGGS